MKKFFASLLIVANLLTTAVVANAEVQNAQVTCDEIITMTSDILEIIDVQFKREIVNDNTTRIRATVKANIDSEDLNKWLAKNLQERSTPVAQNEEMQQFAAEDKIFLSNQKVDEAGCNRELCYEALGK